MDCSVVYTQPPHNLNKCVAQGVDKLLGPTPRSGEVSPASAHKPLVPESMVKRIYNVADKAAESIPNSANPTTGGSKTTSVGRHLQDSSARRSNPDTNMLLHSQSQLHAQPLRSAVGVARHQNARPASTYSMAINAYPPAPYAAPGHPRVLQIATRGASGPSTVVGSVHYKYAKTSSGGRAQSADSGQIFTLDRSFLC
jgi:hypothetical protein